MEEPFEKSIEKWTDAELIEAMRQSLPRMIPYGEMVGAEAPYGHSGPMVWENAECYFMAEAANRLERYAPVWHAANVDFPTDEMLQENNEFLVMIKGAANPTTLLFEEIPGEWIDEDGNAYLVEWWMPLPAPPKKGE